MGKRERDGEEGMGDGKRRKGSGDGKRREGKGEWG